MPRKLRNGRVRPTLASFARGLLAIPAVAFPFFPKLPLELRTMIIELAIETRMVEISHAGTPTQALIAMPQFTQPVCQVVTRAPALLHVNKEVRDIAIKSYKLVDLDYLVTPFYFQPTADTIYLTSNAVLWEMLKGSSSLASMGITRLRVCMNNAPDREYLEKLTKEGVSDYRGDRWATTAETCKLRAIPICAVVKIVKSLEETLEKVIVDTEHESFIGTDVHIQEKLEGVVRVRFPYWND
ncbi:hypothetical protein BKA65DRAFT_234830 [Rhexocercosporidium sp. MPI-PUGE-AT-0058]|nr:hypothetical protein BKA65DRAFT_234830 [Rhexocercosporidium sp. MPI-PUGE-AT-0058]